MWAALRIISTNFHALGPGALEKPSLANAWRDAAAYRGWKAFLLGAFVVVTWATIIVFPLTIVVIVGGSLER